MWLNVIVVAYFEYDCFYTVDKAASSNIECPPMDYTAYVFYINFEWNMWKMHFNVTKKLDALLQVNTHSLLHVLLYYRLTFTCSKSRKSMMHMMRLLTFSFNFVMMDSY